MLRFLDDSIRIIGQRHPLSYRIRLLFSYLWIKIQARWGRKEISFLGFVISAPSINNVITIIREVFIYEDYMVSLDEKTPFIIDCGGNVGVTVLYWKYFYPNAEVVVFEPSPMNVSYLKKNVSDNTLTGVRIVESAVGSREGVMKFWENTLYPGGSTGEREVYESKHMANYREVTVPVVTLDTFITRRVSVLKIDIEGSEGVVIEHLYSTKKIGSINTIIFEYHYNEKNLKNNLSSIVSIFEKSKFRFSMYTNDSSVYYSSVPKISHFMIHAKNSEF
ncbi:MAG: FkbM family methyltransferase [Candidatus Paceibacterota bacterium]